MEEMYRRYEVLLPRCLSDGRPVTRALLDQTLHELDENLRGQRTFRGHGYRNDLVRLFIDVPDTRENRQFIVAFKERLKIGFQQLDIWITTHPLEIL